MATEKTCPATVTQTIKSAISKNPINALLRPVKMEKTFSKASSREFLMIGKSDSARVRAISAPATVSASMAGSYLISVAQKVFGRIVF